MSLMIASRALTVPLLLSTASALAAAPKTYQVTGPVVELTDSKVVVQKGKETWELQRDATTKVNGDLKVGAKVSIQYVMTATAVTATPEKSAKK